MRRFDDAEPEREDQSSTGSPAIAVPHRRATGFRPYISRAALVLTDIAMLVVSALLAYATRLEIGGLGWAGDLAAHIATTAWVVGAGWVLMIIVFGGYSRRYLFSGTEEYRQVVHASIAAAGIAGTAIYFLDYELSRVYFVLLFGYGTLALLLGRLVVRRVFQILHSRGHMVRRALVVGDEAGYATVEQSLRRESWLGYAVVGRVDPADIPAGPRVPLRSAAPGDSCDHALVAAITDSRADLVIFSPGATRSAEDFRRLAWDLEELAVELIVMPNFRDISTDRVQMRPVAGLPFVHLEPPRAVNAVALSKRLTDIVLSLLFIVLLSPLMLLAAIMVKAHDGGPLLFRQTRVGRDGAEFSFLKFRSMAVDAEERLAALRADAHSNGLMFKMRQDPRVTRPGRFLRRFSIDELPQLVNVLRGDMSLIGPRPALPEEVSRYDADAMRRLRVRPGMTGLWQVSGRSDLSWEETVRLDLFYVDNWSFVQDAAILVRTLHAVVSSRGAY